MLCSGPLTSMHWTLRLVLQLGPKLSLNRTFVRQCLQNLLNLLSWIRRHCGLLKGPLDGKSSPATRDGIGASPGLPEKETPLSGVHSVGHHPSTSSAVPGLMDAISCPVDPLSSRRSLQVPTMDPQVLDEPQQNVSGSPDPLPDHPDIPLSPERQTSSESQSFSHPTLRPFPPVNLGRYERNIEMYGFTISMCPQGMILYHRQRSSVEYEKIPLLTTSFQK